MPFSSYPSSEQSAVQTILAGRYVIVWRYNAWVLQYMLVDKLPNELSFDEPYRFRFYATEPGSLDEELNYTSSASIGDDVTISVFPSLDMALQKVPSLEMALNIQSLPTPLPNMCPILPTRRSSGDASRKINYVLVLSTTYNSLFWVFGFVDSNELLEVLALLKTIAPNSAAVAESDTFCNPIQNQNQHDDGRNSLTGDNDDDNDIKSDSDIDSDSGFDINDTSDMAQKRYYGGNQKDFSPEALIRHTKSSQDGPDSFFSVSLHDLSAPKGSKSISNQKPSQTTLKPTPSSLYSKPSDADESALSSLLHPKTNDTQVKERSGSLSRSTTFQNSTSNDFSHIGSIELSLQYDFGLSVKDSPPAEGTSNLNLNSTVANSRVSRSQSFSTSMNHMSKNRKSSQTRQSPNSEQVRRSNGGDIEEGGSEGEDEAEAEGKENGHGHGHANSNDKDDNDNDHDDDDDDDDDKNGESTTFCKNSNSNVHIDHDDQYRDSSFHVVRHVVDAEEAKTDVFADYFSDSADSSSLSTTNRLSQQQQHQQRQHRHKNTLNEKSNKIEKNEKKKEINSRLRGTSVTVKEKEKKGTLRQVDLDHGLFDESEDDFKCPQKNGDHLHIHNTAGIDLDIDGNVIGDDDDDGDDNDNDDIDQDIAITSSYSFVDLADSVSTGRYPTHHQQVPARTSNSKSKHLRDETTSSSLSTIPSTSSTSTSTSTSTSLPTSAINLSTGAGVNESRKKQMIMQAGHSAAAVRQNRVFQNIFNLPPNQNLLCDIPCSVSQTIPLRGRLYLSQDYVCFYSSLFGFRTVIIAPKTQIVSARVSVSRGTLELTWVNEADVSQTPDTVASSTSMSTTETSHNPTSTPASHTMNPGKVPSQLLPYHRFQQLLLQNVSQQSMQLQHGMSLPNNRSRSSASSSLSNINAHADVSSTTRGRSTSQLGLGNNSDTTTTTTTTDDRGQSISSSQEISALSNTPSLSQERSHMSSSSEIDTPMTAVSLSRSSQSNSISTSTSTSLNNKIGNDLGIGLDLVSSAAGTIPTRVFTQAEIEGKYPSCLQRYRFSGLGPEDSLLLRIRLLEVVPYAIVPDALREHHQRLLEMYIAEAEAHREQMKIHQKEALRAALKAEDFVAEQLSREKKEREREKKEKEKKEKEKKEKEKEIEKEKAKQLKAEKARLADIEKQEKMDKAKKDATSSSASYAQDPATVTSIVSTASSSPSTSTSHSTGQTSSPSASTSTSTSTSTSSGTTVSTIDIESLKSTTLLTSILTPPPEKTSLAANLDQDYGTLRPPFGDQLPLQSDLDLQKVADANLPISPAGIFHMFLSDTAPYSVPSFVLSREKHTDARVSAWVPHTPLQQPHSDCAKLSWARNPSMSPMDQLGVEKGKLHPASLLDTFGIHSAFHRDLFYIMPLDAPIGPDKTRMFKSQMIYTLVPNEKTSATANFDISQPQAFVMVSICCTPDAPFGDNFHVVEIWRVQSIPSNEPGVFHSKFEAFAAANVFNRPWKLRPFLGTLVGRTKTDATAMHTDLLKKYQNFLDSTQGKSYLEDIIKCNRILTVTPLIMTPDVVQERLQLLSKASSADAVSSTSASTSTQVSMTSATSSDVKGEVGVEPPSKLHSTSQSTSGTSLSLSTGLETDSLNRLQVQLYILYAILAIVVLLLMLVLYQNYLLHQKFDLMVGIVNRI